MCEGGRVPSFLKVGIVKKGLSVRERLPRGSYAQRNIATVLFFICVLNGRNLFAQAAGEGFTQATSEVVRYFALGITLMYAIGAVVGIVGAIKKSTISWNSGDQDTGKVAASWFGSCIFSSSGHHSKKASSSIISKIQQQIYA